ncbi:MAG: adenylate/guanylate cyclase domain-containing protein, partial [Flavobacteriales bacterium]
TPYIIDTRDPEGRVRPIRIDAPPVTGMPGGRIFRTDMTMVHDSVHNAIYGVYTKGIMRIDAAHATASTLYEDLDQPSLLSGTGAIVDATGRCWLPTQAGGVRRFDPATGRLSAIRSEASDLDPYLQYVKCAYRDRNGLIWLGLSGYGLLTYDPRVERFQLMPGPSIRYMMPGLNGKLVMNEGNFLSVYDPGGRAYDLRLGIVEVREQAGFTQGFWGNDAVVQDRTGAFWTSKGGLVRYEHAARSMERAIPTAADPRLPVSSSCFPLKLIGDTLWFGADSGLFWCDPVSRRYDRLTSYPIVPVNNPYTFLQALHRDARGDFWAGTVKGLFRFDARTRRWTHYHNDPDDPSTLSVDVLFSILPDPHDPEGVLWIGTNGGGLNRFDVKTGKVVRYTTKEGLPNDVVYGVLSDDSGKLWMSTNKGIARFDPETRTFRNFTVADGLQNDEFNRYAYCKLPDGRLCFGGVGGFNIFDPRAMEDDRRAASVILTDIKLRNRSIAFWRAGSPISGPPYESAGMEIPYSDNMVTFEFANVEYAAPLAHRYRYRLEGFDKDWITTVGDHAAIYTNLDPGTYMFRVAGANRDGHWGDTETTFRLVVLPPWWRTWWFYALCTIVVAGGALLYIGSLRRQVRLRTAQLLTEKVRSEDLLNNILPVSVATELKEKGTSQAAYFEQATVLLTDIKDFTRISERMDAALLVDELNTCFKAFDRIMEKYGVEKIRTIGDAYMAVGGVPAPRVGAPQAVVLAGLEMQRIMQERKNELSAAGKPWFEMRLGIHTGPVVAGIVGARKFQYDLWGDTVSIARLMESSGEVGEVNISGATYALVKDEPGAHFTLRGRVTIRGLGELAMYRVHPRSEQVVAEAGPVKHSLATSVPPG